jgi:hypothetical protein
MVFAISGSKPAKDWGMTVCSSKNVLLETNQAGGQPA